MTSTTSTSNNNNNVNNELASFYSAFRADDTLIDIIPAFDYSYNHDHNSNSNNRRNNSDDDENDDITNLFQSTLSSTSIFGGGTNQNVKAGLTYTVPIWMAIVLQQRSFATMVYPTDVWYNIPNLKYILLYEKTNVSLFHTTTSTSTDTNDTTTNSLSKPPRRNRHDDDSNDDDDETTDNNHNNETMVQQQPSSIKNNDYYLPSNYFELAMRFKASISTNMNTSTTTSTTTTTMNHMDVLTLLIQDIYDIRMDKLRQQFQTLLYDTTKHISPLPSTTSSSTTTTPPNRSSHTTDLIINVTGIGTQELSQIQSYVLQAMNDIYYLES